MGKVSKQSVGSGDLPLGARAKAAEEKISYALQKLLLIEVPKGAAFSDFERVLGVIVVAWNISLHDPEKRAGMIQEMMEKNYAQESDAIRREMVYLLERLIISKEVFFPDDKRWVDFAELKRKGGKWYVFASGVVLPAEGDKGRLVVE